ncbi:hypothetical protein ARSEF1564_003691 [Beauveria bassiana]
MAGFPTARSAQSHLHHGFYGFHGFQEAHDDPERQPTPVFRLIRPTDSLRLERLRFRASAVARAMVLAAGLNQSQISLFVISGFDATIGFGWKEFCSGLLQLFTKADYPSWSNKYINNTSTNDWLALDIYGYCTHLGGPLH